MNCPSCGNLMAPCEALVYRTCEDCWVKRNFVQRPGPGCGMYVRTGATRRKDEHGRMEETGYTFRIGARTPK